MFGILSRLLGTNAPPPPARQANVAPLADARGLIGLDQKEYDDFPEMAEWRISQIQRAREIEKKIERDEATPSDFLALAECMTNSSRFNMGRLYIEEALRRTHATGESLVRSFTLFVTELCNLRCEHCYIYDEVAGPFLRRSDELNTEQVVTIVEKIAAPGKPCNIFFSGGEVFARPDLEEIFRRIASKGIRFGFGTNGTFPKRLDAVLGNEEIRSVLTNVQFSIDGIKDSHERVRGKNTFEPLIESIKIAKKHGVETSGVTVIQNGNLDDVHATEAMIKELGIDHHRFQYHAKGRFLHTPDIQRFRKKVSMREHHLATFSPTVPGAGCTAGIDTCSIRSNGVVEACRMSVVGNVPKLVLGDLKEFNFDIHALLRSDQAKRVQCQVQDCIGCAFYCAR